jgi:hypothetical protein
MDKSCTEAYANTKIWFSGQKLYVQYLMVCKRRNILGDALEKHHNKRYQ